MPRKPAIGVLDLGASGGRVFAAVEYPAGLHVEEIYRFSHNPENFWQRESSGKTVRRPCWDFQRLYAGMKEGLQAIAARPDLELTSFGLDTWGSDGMWINARGDLLGPVATGRDPRWAEMMDQLHREISAWKLFELTGVQSHPFNVLSQLCWFVRNEPHIVDHAAQYLSVNGLLYFLLTGTGVAEYTWSSTTQLCKPGRPEYQNEILNRLNLPLAKLPSIVLPGTSLGSCLREFADDAGLKPFGVTVSAAHDTACAYACAERAPGRCPLIISTGTWFLAGIIREQPLLSRAAFDAGFTNEAGVEGTRFLKNIMGSWPAQELRRLWSRFDQRELPWETLGSMAASASAFPNILDIDDPSFFAPEDMEAALRRFCLRTGQKPPSARGEMARAVYEGLALQVALVARQVESLTEVRLDEILLLGGGVRNDLLNQWISDASGLPVRLGHADATACGNALVQARSLGWVASLEEGRERFAGGGGRVFQPGEREPWVRALNHLIRLKHEALR